MKRGISDTEAIKIYVLPEKEGYSWRVDPPASLKSKEKELPHYGPRGFWLKNWIELQQWIEKVWDLKYQELRSGK